MARATITDAMVSAKAPITEDLMKDKIKNNDTDHEDRIVVLEGNATNWTDQLGTLITDTDMGTFDHGDFDNDDVKEILQVFEDSLNSHGRDYAATTENWHYQSDWRTMATVTIKTSGKPCVVNWGLEVMNNLTTNSCTFQLELDGNTPLSNHEVNFRVFDTGVSSTRHIETAGGATMPHNTPTYNRNQTAQTFTFGSPSSFGNNADRFFRYDVLTNYLPLVAGSHTFTVMCRANQSSNFQSNARYAYLNVSELF